MSRSNSAPFELQIQSDEHEGYQFALWQQVVRQNGSKHAHRRRVASLHGTPLLVAMDYILNTLKAEGYRATAVRSMEGEPLQISDEAGVRLGLLFLTLKPLSKIERIEAIAVGLHDMPAEELYYWFSKCVSSDGNRNAQCALRVLLGGD